MMISKDIKILIKDRNNKIDDITGIVTKVTWSGDYKQASRTLEFDILGTNIDSNLRETRIHEGFSVQFYEEGKELFRGWIYSQSRNSNSNTIRYTAFDYGAKLVDIKDAFNFKNETPESITKTVLSKYNLKAGDIIETGVEYSKIFIDVSLYDIIMSAYTFANANNNKNYMVSVKGDTFSVEEKGKIALKLAFEEGKNISDNKYDSSIVNMVNHVVIVDENGNKQSIVEDEDNQKLYGLFQRIIQTQEGKSSTIEAYKMLNGIEQKSSLTGFGDSTCVTGTAVTVKDAYTGMTGLFYIDGDKHTWEDFKHTVELDLSFKNIMNEVTAGQDEQKESSTDDIDQYLSNGTAILNGKEVKALFTAYYPENSALQGGFYDAMGNKLDPSKKTCAAPKSVPFGTKIQIQGTGTSKDGETYTVTDRGGAIIVRNGVYQFDLLMSNRKEAYSWGRVNGSAIIGDGTGYKSTGGSSTVSASGKQGRVIELVKQQLGKPYVWGATGPKSFDCSGLTMWCYKQVGVNIPRVSYEQATYGKLVSRSQLQPGDLLFFDTMNKGRVSHVGMYVGGGKMVHAANPKKGVRTDDIGGYYAKVFINARRVL